ncbi:hypothetical protein MHU86_22677 [Fragilaria crotonensis]|nr:hypothetical protein MHU86_22677 [Fragilaria crotonensis]
MLRIKLADDPKQLATSLFVEISQYSNKTTQEGTFPNIPTSSTMDDDEQSEEFTEALVYIGFNRVTAEAIVAQGFTSPLTLLTVSEDSLSDDEAGCKEQPTPRS